MNIPCLMDKTLILYLFHLISFRVTLLKKKKNQSLNSEGYSGESREKLKMKKETLEKAKNIHQYELRYLFSLMKYPVKLQDFHTKYLKYFISA